MSAILIENSRAWYALLATLFSAIDPVSTLYGLLAGTYGSAAVAAGANDHRTLGRCYVISAALHAVIGVCHHLHV